MVDNERLERQIQFIIEIDKLKKICRQTLLMDGSRHENDAEHSWHLAVMAILLSEYACDGGINVPKVIKMVLIHDIIEIDAGDTFCYDDKAHEDKQQREQRAADRLFAILPPDQAQEFMEIWREFEERTTIEARFAAALDRLQPLLHNYHTKGYSWQKHKITSDRVVKRNEAIEDASTVLWNYARELIDKSIDKGYLTP